MLEGLVAPLRVVLQRSLADWLLVAATWVVILSATTLLAVGVLYGDAVALSGLRQRLADEPQAATTVEVGMRVDPADLDAVDDVVDSQARRILAWAEGQLVRGIRSGSLDLVSGVGGLSDTDLGVAAALDRLEDHATLVSGAWPSPERQPLEATVSAPAAERLGIRVGDVVSVRSRSGSGSEIDVLVSGIWQPTDPADRYWEAGSLELTGIEEGASFTLHGPLMVTTEDLIGSLTAGKLDVTWRALPDFDRLALQNVRWMRSDAAALEGRIRAELGSGSFFAVGTDLPRVLREADRSLLVSRSGVLVLTIQFVVLAGYALILVAGLLAEHRRIETSLLRSRGAGMMHIALLAALEAVLLVVPAVLVAPWVALAALQLFDVVGPLAAAGVSIQPRIDGATLAVAAVAGVASLIGVVLPAVAGGGGLASVRQSMARQSGSSLAQRMGIDVALLALAAIGIWQLRQYGAPLTATVRGDLGLDPLLVAAPAMALVAGAILALRIVPLLAELAERAFGPRAGLVAPLGARQLARRPLRYTRSALLLILASAMGTFAAAYIGSWQRSQADQAAYRTGADLRLEVSGFPDLPAWALGPAYEGADGVQSAMPVLTDTFDVAGRVSGGQLLGIGAERLVGTVDVRSDLLGGLALDEAAGRLVPTTDDIGGIPLPESVTGLVLEFTTSLESHPGPSGDEPGGLAFTGELRADFPIGQVSVAVRDATGAVHVVNAGSRLRAAEDGQVVEVPLVESGSDGGTLRMPGPVQLIGVDVSLQPPADTRIAGEVTLVAVNPSGEATDGPSLLDDGTGQRWSWLVQRSGGTATATPTGGDDPATLRVSLREAIYGDQGPARLRFTPPDFTRLASTTVPVIVSQTFADATHVEMGTTLSLGSLTRRYEVEVVGIVDGFPTLDPSRPFAIGDVGTLALASYARSGQELFIDEWWLRVDDQGVASAALSGDPFSVERLTSRDGLVRSLGDDPVALGIVGALAIGSVSALIVAIIGFAVSAVVSTRERLGEFALLRAVGLSSRQLSAWLTFEFAFLLTIGAGAGSALGLLLSWLVLPFVTLTADAQAAFPPIVIVVPWVAIIGIHAVAAAALVGAVMVTTRVIRRAPVIGVLRAGED